MSKKAAVMIDTWKLPIFKRVLEEADYVYEQLPGININTIILVVKCDFIGKLKPFIEKAEAECRICRRRP